MRSSKSKGREHATSLALREEMQEKFVEFKLNPKLFEVLAEIITGVIKDVRKAKQSIFDICVKQAKMTRKDFLASFKDNETNLKWVDSVSKQKKSFAPIIPAKKIIDEFEVIMKKIGYNKEHNKGWMPFWHLSGDNIWNLYSINHQIVKKTAFKPALF